MRKFFTLFLLASAVFAQGQKPTDPRLKGLDTAVQKILADWHAAGVSIAVVEKNKVVYAGGFGYRDYEKKLPVTATTLFGIGSCTKAFTASMVGMLAKEEKVDLDKPVRNYLPELRFYKEELNSQVTLRDMMCHRTGLPRHDFSWYGSTATRAELLDRIQYLEPTAGFREKFQYNNFMFMAQGMVLEKLTGKSWEANLQERILTPLRMTSTKSSIKAMETSADASLAYTVKGDSIHKIPYRDIDAMGPAGSINSCAADMANWLITWINGGKFEGKEIIPASFVNQARVAQMVTGGYPGTENPDVFGVGYGLGWGMGAYRGHYRVEHSGGIDGFITSTAFFPTDSIGIFVVSSQGGPTNSIRNWIADRLLKQKYFNWSKMMLDEEAGTVKASANLPNADSAGRKPNTKPSHAREDYAGVYENKGYGKVTVFIEKDTIWVDYNEAGKRTTSYLKHYHYDVFSIRSTEETEEPKTTQKLQFTINSQGNIATLEVGMQPGLKDIVFEKLSPSIDVDAAGLQKYVGDYDLNGATIKVYIKGENTLMVLVPGQPDYELSATRPHEFDLKVAKGYSVKFEVDNNGEATTLSFVQPNGTFTAKRKK